jgi:hypothetical protein
MSVAANSSSNGTDAGVFGDSNPRVGVITSAVAETPRRATTARA